MDRSQCEVCAPWALRFYDAGAAHEKASNDWKSIDAHVPEQDKLLLYYFNDVGIWLGYYKGIDPVHPDFGSGGHVFVSRDNHGFLTGDVTHWKYIEEPEL